LITDLYKILGVGKKATKAQIRAAYRRKAKTAHPDAGGDPEAFHAISKAYRILSNDKARARYDETGNADEATASTMDNTTALAMEILAQLLGDALETDAALNVDLTKEIAGVLAESSAEIAVAITKVETKIARIEKVARKFILKDQEVPNHIQMILDHGRGVEKDHLDRHQARHAAINRASEIIGSFTYEPDASKAAATPETEIDRLMKDLLGSHGGRVYKKGPFV
jgi:hypothetical protein